MIIIAMLTCLGMILTLNDVSVPVLRVVFGLPLVLFCPGYALVAALIPGKSLELLFRLILSVGVSLMLTILGGLALHWVAAGLYADSWALFLGSLTFGGCALALVRRARAGGDARDGAVVTLPDLAINRKQGVTFGMAFVVIVIAVMIARFGASQLVTGGFTQFWMLPVPEDGPNIVRVGIHSREAQAERYRVEVMVGSATVKEWPTIELEPDERWETRLVLPIESTSAITTSVRANVYSLDAPNKIYRRAFLRGPEEF
jgi:uncharacterized membrane protein